MTLCARVLVVLLAGALVGCGDGSPSTSTSAPGPPPGAGGEITTVINQQAFIDGAPGGGGDTIPAGGLLETDDSGVAIFVVAGDPTRCELGSASAVVVLPTEDLVLRLMRGQFVCDRSGTSSSATFAAPGSLIEVGDSTVVVGATEDGSTVGNVRGEVAVAPAEAGATDVPQQDFVPLEGRHRTRVLEGEVPETPSPYRPSDDVTEAVSRMNPVTTDPGATLPGRTTTSSATTVTTGSSTTGTQVSKGDQGGST